MVAAAPPLLFKKKTPHQQHTDTIYVLTYINDRLILINVKKLHMSILFCTFVVEIITKTHNHDTTNQ